MYQYDDKEFKFQYPYRIRIRIMSDRNSNEEEKDISFSSLMIINRLGRGSTCHVFKTQSIRTKKYYAMKVIDKGNSNYHHGSLLREIGIHGMLRHQHICHFVRHFQDRENQYMLTEYCNNGEATKLLMKPVGESQIAKMIWQIGSALNYMHNQVRVAHGDLKLSNILINESDYKLCDFGYSVRLGAENLKPEGIFGTLLYMSPQILKNQGVVCYQKSDIWSFGMCILILMLQGNPYSTESPNLLRQKILNSEFIKPCKSKFPNFSGQFLSLVSQMLEPNSQKRIKIRQVLKSAALHKYNEKQLPQNLFEFQNGQKSKINPQQDSSDNEKPTEQLQKQNLNKSAFNSTIDTLIEQEETLSPEIYSYCLKPQRHETQNNGFIEILINHSIKIKVDKLEYIIAANGSTLQILKGSKNLRVYSWSQIVANSKIKSLFDYACELVGILKKKICLKQKIINGKYFWTTKTSICHLKDSKNILQKKKGSQQILLHNIGSQETNYQPALLHKPSKYLQLFQKAEKELFLNN